VTVDGPPSASRRRRLLAVAAAVVSASAFGGALGLVTGTLDLGASVTERLPWESAVVGGVALALWVGVPFAVLAVLAWRGSARTGAVAVAAGGLVIGWIVVQVACIRTFSPFQPTYLVVGLGFVGAGRHRPATAG
jgi:hypothetical protein